ncbi:MAG: 16S rRNA (adenine(1518)-N(6)/adenine(1519)-N(6))-dimethyltransferase RsmA [Thermoleophilia bacterium]|nr:16S rRNA (adenine(1518)-N(6)/adenine(1519)-N(6))-dimethyltransferase RsmA [Thermoleophilia bacterium]
MADESNIEPQNQWARHGRVEPAEGLKQVSLARLAEFGLTPKRSLGQNFLIDDNILRLILRLLECQPADVVLEVGAGLGILTAALARVARHVHAFEVDLRLEGPLRATLGEAPNVTLHFQDIMTARLENLEPAPTLCASNLPYSVAAPFLIEALRALPGVRRYCVMVQREIAERMAAPPGGKTYGVLSVWVQLYAQIVQIRPLARTIFFPAPHVDSCLVVLERMGRDQEPACDKNYLAAVVQAAFGQRRKTLVNALSGGLAVSREVAAAAVSALGLPPRVRAEQLTPGQFVALAGTLADLERRSGVWHSKPESANHA